MFKGKGFGQGNLGKSCWAPCALVGNGVFKIVDNACRGFMGVDVETEEK